MKKYFIIFIIGSLLYWTQFHSKAPLEIAKEHIAENELDKALIVLKNAIQDTPNISELRFLLGKLYFDNFQYENAIKELERAIKYEHAKAEIFPMLAFSYKKTENDLALISLVADKANLLPEQIVEIKLYQVQAYLRLNKESEAKEFISEIKQSNIKSSFASLALVYEALIAKNNHSAKFQLAKILENDKKQPDALLLQAIVQIQMQDIEGSLDSYRTYVQAYPNDLTTSFIFARMLALHDKTEEAEPILDKSLILNSDNPLLNQLKGLARFNAKDYETALPYLEKALIGTPTHLNTRLAAGTSAFKLKDYEKSHQHLSFIVKTLPSSHHALRLLAASELAIGLSLDASKTIDKFDELRAEDITLLSSVGLSLALKGEKRKAQEYLNKVNKLTESNPHNLPQLSLLKMALGDTSGITSLEKQLENNPINSTTGSINQSSSSLPLDNILARSYLSSQEFDKAIDLANKLKNDKDDSIKGYMLAGFIYSEQQELNFARIEFEKALKIEPNNVKIKLSLIDLLPRQSAEEQRIIVTKLEELLELEPNFTPLLSRYFIYNKQLGTPEKAIEFTRDNFTDQPKNLALALTLGKMYFTEKNYEDTIKTLTSIEDINNKPSQYWKLLVRSYIKTNNVMEINDTYQHWLEKFPNDKEANIGNILALQIQNKEAEALKLAEAYITKQGNDTEVGILHISLLLKNKKNVLAQRAYDILPMEAYNLPVVKGFLGRLLFNERKFEEALPKLQAAYKGEPSPENTDLVYQCLNKLKQSKKAYDFIFQHSTSHPDDVTTLMRLASLQIFKHSNQAIINYRKIINKNNNNALAHNNLAYLLAQKGDNNSALKHAEEAIRIQPNNSDYLDTIGRILLDLNQNNDALMHLSKAVDNNTTMNEGIYLNYIEALIANKEMFMANKLLNEVEFTASFLPEKQRLEKKIIK